MVWIPKEPKYKPKPPTKSTNTSTNTPTDVLEDGNEMTNQEAIIQLRLGPGINEDVSEKYNDAVNMAIEALKAQDRPKGEWIDIPYTPSHTKYMCSECGKTIYTNSDYIKEHKFCFSCGADMRGKNK